jgi:hypothetical protein
MMQYVDHDTYIETPRSTIERAVFLVSTGRRLVGEYSIGRQVDRIVSNHSYCTATHKFWKLLQSCVNACIMLHTRLDWQTTGSRKNRRRKKELISTYRALETTFRAEKRLVVR